MNPHQLDVMKLRGGMGGIQIVWKCSCGEERETDYNVKRSQGPDNWRRAADTAYVDHNKHVDEVANG